ncbi:MAG: M14 family zinc carboxypeptidase [Acidobacteriota bacterium]
MSRPAAPEPMLAASLRSLVIAGMFLLAALCVACSASSDSEAEPGEVAESVAQEEPPAEEPSESVSAAELAEQQIDSEQNWELVDGLCNAIGRKLGSVSVVDCISRKLIATGRESVEGRPLLRRDYRPRSARPTLGRVLVLGGIHGDEYSSVSIVFKWLRKLDLEHDGTFHWRFLPLVNPDGLLREQSQRMNSRGIDLNRNFPTADWEADSKDYWVRRTGRNPRRYPGESPLSEPESRFVHEQMEAFQPDLVVSIHAPLEVVDFDGAQQEPPEKLGSLELKRLGTYPGSLGRYGNERHDVAVLTLELASAGIMPSVQEQDQIWRDLNDYLRRTLGSVAPEAGVSGG